MYGYLVGNFLVLIGLDILLILGRFYIPVGVLLLILIIGKIILAGNLMGFSSNQISEGLQRLLPYIKKNVSFDPENPQVQWLKDITFSQDKIPNGRISLTYDSQTTDCLLVIHGVTAAGAVMYEVSKKLHQEYSIDTYIVTLPQHAGLVQDLDALTMDTVRDFVRNQIRYFSKKYSQVYVLGHSLGGLTPTYLWLTDTDFPKNVKFILCAPALATTLDTPEGFLDFLSKSLQNMYLQTSFMSKYMQSFMDWMYVFCAQNPAGKDSSYYTCFNPTPKAVMLKVANFAREFKKLALTIDLNDVPEGKERFYCLYFKNDRVVSNISLIRIFKRLGFKYDEVQNCGHSPFGVTNESDPYHKIKEAMDYLRAL